MKKIIILISITLFCIVSISGQERKGSREKIKALKISYLTEQLNLTSDEAEKFWPIYNAYDNKFNKYLREQIGQIKKEIFKAGSVDNLDDKRAEDLFKLMRLLEKKKYEENEKFISKLQKVLPIKKIIKLQIAEREFGRKLMRKYKHKKRISEKKK